jgi:hypothetical protein
MLHVVAGKTLAVRPAPATPGTGEGLRGDRASCCLKDAMSCEARGPLPRCSMSADCGARRPPRRAPFPAAPRQLHRSLGRMRSSTPIRGRLNRDRRRSRTFREARSRARPVLLFLNRLHRRDPRALLSRVGAATRLARRPLDELTSAAAGVPAVVRRGTCRPAERRDGGRVFDRVGARPPWWRPPFGRARDGAWPRARAGARRPSGRDACLVCCAAEARGVTARSGAVSTGNGSSCRGDRCGPSSGSTRPG